ncbi:DHH family phosphoesterase [Fructilactobacillus sanfranciscensis]|uniref:DHH family phosphoesterase n=1 Tax=Fructilactobacillus sanfranciscensis TaxID=1625 RepID=UPI0006EF1A9E|nr:bifunctional oligoribonuclease/PAP phosphatase NrnA [Fructilactobacillus sanfranciscensis]KRM81137.1 Bifunctional oligoribonuclease and PAP phosphatase nrnA [Fructilactobacillus sanfranciscensis DSM 20451]POH24304.1 oligoribonuclease [Fructilactobacillus sanfranciscensis DSM 20451]QFX94116.1 bifunctional oligoribonuclease/PAP phosphatase NrnA [Fructilactobacillus sanfranciscensis]RDX59954.1 bifunctional oligoribonuclease/PAP phosphatase NrnA [Fructilactobacillus sanfranciscensis]
MNIKEQIFEKISEYDTIIIHRHQRPDPDAVGSQMGLGHLIRATFPNKKVYCVGKQYKSFAWLGETDEVSDEDYKDALVIVCDTANQPRVDDNRFNQGKYLLKIDHHPNDDEFGNLMWVNPEASSVSEMIYDLYAANALMKLSDDGARDLYAGIVGDTGRFKYPSTSSHTFKVASGLTKFDFSLNEIAQREDEIDVPLAHLAAYVYQNLKISESGAAYIILTNEIVEKLKLGDDSTSSVVPLPGNIGSVVDWAIFVQQKEGDYRIRLRSKGPSINELAKQHNGGGHALASGAVAKDENEIKQVVAELDQLTKEYNKKGKN